MCTNVRPISRFCTLSIAAEIFTCVRAARVYCVFLRIFHILKKSLLNDSNALVRCSKLYTCAARLHNRMLSFSRLSPLESRVRDVTETKRGRSCLCQPSRIQPTMKSGAPPPLCSVPVLYRTHYTRNNLCADRQPRAACRRHVMYACSLSADSISMCCRLVGARCGAADGRASHSLRSDLTAQASGADYTTPPKLYDLSAIDLLFFRVIRLCSLIWILALRSRFE